jgi:hypothetical protein
MEDVINIIAILSFILSLLKIYQSLNNKSKLIDAKIDDFVDEISEMLSIAQIKNSAISDKVGEIGIELKKIMDNNNNTGTNES